MHVKTMEGLVGARMNMNLSRVPMRAYKEAEKRGDIQGMDRAMQYVGGFVEDAKGYEKKAEEGMKEEAEEIKEKRAQESKAAAEKHGAGNEKLEKDTKENKMEKADTVEISQKGMELSAEMKGKGSIGRMEDGADVINSDMR